MPAPLYSVADFAAGLLALLPTGRAWPREPDAVIAQVMAAQAPSYARLHARANALLVDAFPATAVELLPEWEAALGLPDPCAGPDATIAQRQAHVVARLTQDDGPSIPSLTSFAAALGFTITIQEFAPARADVSGADDPCYEPEWAFVWRVSVAAVTVEYASADISYADDPLLTFGGDVLECELRRLSPAHTILQFEYSGPANEADWDAGGWSRDGWA